MRTYIVFVDGRPGAFGFTAGFPPTVGTIIILDEPDGSAVRVTEVRSVGGIDTIIAEPIDPDQPDVSLASP